MKDVTKQIQDGISLKIYNARRELFHTGDGKKYINVINELPERKDWFRRLTGGRQNSSYSLFGAGEDAKMMLKFMEYYCKEKPQYIYDNNKNLWGKKVNSISVSSPEKIMDNNDLIYIAAVKYKKEILQQLNSIGVSTERIVEIDENILYEWNNRQYFDLFLPGEKEVFVDAGAYDASTDINFAKWCNHSYEDIFAFEAAKNFAEISRLNLKENKVEGLVIEKGLWSETTTLNFYNTGGQASQIVDEDNSQVTDQIEVVSLDDYFKEKAVTFIKMDIEGSELEALKGGKNLIMSNKPRLAISLYHKSDDIIKIPEYILSLVPEYKLYLRTYGFGVRDDTVLYATL